MEQLLGMGPSDSTSTMMKLMTAVLTFAVVRSTGSIRCGAGNRWCLALKLLQDSILKSLTAMIMIASRPRTVPATLRMLLFEIRECTSR